MTESADLPRLLRRIRIRARVLATVEGAVRGGALGAGALAAALAIARVVDGAAAARTRPGLVTLAAALAALLGAALAAARRVPLAHCARLLDAALDRGGPPRDRVLSALSFLGGPDTPFARAAVADAVARARGLTPARVAPARRPRRLPALAGAAVALALVTAWPARAPGARAGATAVVLPAPMLAPRARVTAHALDAERAEARAAADAAAADGDVRLAKLAAELHATLDSLTAGELGAGEALDRLGDLARRAKEAGDDAAAARAALRAAAKALEPTADTRGLGRALGADETDATESALRALAARLSEGAGDKTNERVARAFDAAAAALGGGAGEDASDDGEGAHRRLRRDDAAKPGAATSDGATRTTDERRLERLRRDLEDTASACRGDAAACARSLSDRADQLQRLQREARGSEARRRVETAARQARERLRRGELERPPEGGERRFQRAARGEAQGREGTAEGRAAGERAPGGAPSGSSSNETQVIESEGGSGDDTFAEETGGTSPASDTGDGTASSSRDGDQAGVTAQGQGAGHEPGGDPLGAASTPPTHGHEREARVHNGAGPTRSEVIQAAAHRGFATRDYVRVWSDYQPVVEESLAAGAVPEGRRYLVRRYFQLIRPRAAPAPRTP